MHIIISPSILAADLSNLRSELKRVPNADRIHIDVMDGRYVPNISFGLPVVQAAQRSTHLPLDIHLMIEEPQRYLGDFAAARPEVLTVHYEAVPHLQGTLRKIRDLGVKAGVSLNPHTPLDGLQYVLDDLDLILVMTVNPGFGGQSFIPAMLQKVRNCRSMIGPRQIELQVDGGVSLETLPDLAQAGATNFVAGSAVFGAENPKEYIEQMRSLAEQG